MMEPDLFLWAQRLQIIDVWQPGNPTGYVTPRVLYDTQVRDQYNTVRAPIHERTRWWVDHGTVGTNTLRYWGTGSTVNNGWSLANYLLPHATTQYADGHYHDTTNVVFKMVPDGFSCNHAGVCIDPVANYNSIGCEYESLQNGTHDIDAGQYVKGALIFAYAAVQHQIKDAFRVPHGLVAVPFGRRTDPWAGLFDISFSWYLVRAIRRDERIWRLWGLPQPSGGY